MERSKLALARMRKHWTLAQAAEYIGCDGNTLNRWELGKTAPRGYNAQRLCEVYEAAPAELGLDLSHAKVGRPRTSSSTDLPSAGKTLSHDPGLDGHQEEAIVLPKNNVSQPEPLLALQASMKHNLTMWLWSLSSPPHHTYQEIGSAMTRILKVYDNMNTKNNHITRRKALLNLVTLPLATLGVGVFTSEESLTPGTIEDILAQCAVSVSACWELRKSTEHSDLVMAHNSILTYLPALQRIVNTSSQYRQEAAGLATQCLFLKSQLAQHVESMNEAQRYAQQAVIYSKEAKNVSLQLKALERLAVVYFFAKQNKQSLQIIEQAVPLLKQKSVPLSPHLQARVNGMLAWALARNGQDGRAYLDQASALLSEPENENPIYASYGEGSLLVDAGMVYHLQGNGLKALELLSHIVDPETFALKMPYSEMGRIGTINIMTMASLKAKEKDMERTLHFWTGGMQAARALQSEQHFNEAVTAYDIMEVVWPGEKKLKEVRELTTHW